MQQIVLKEGKEKPIKSRHHWIFSGAIKTLPDFQNGDCCQVVSSKGEPLGFGYFNKRSKVIGRMLSFDETKGEEAVLAHLKLALDLRQKLFFKKSTTAYRLVNGEGDLLPGLVIDCYNDIYVLQISTLGMEKLRPLVLEWLKRNVSPECIYEKSLLPSRFEEGLKDHQETLFGNVPAKPIEILENGLKFSVSILHGQKTGFFLDHREMRQMVKGISEGKRVLNCFSYTGGFSVYAASGKASSVDSVDISSVAIQNARHNMEINGLNSSSHGFIVDDVFKFLRENPLDYDLVVLDPPAFAKKKKDVVAACRGYKDINRIALQKMPKGSFLLTSSCSYHVDENLFQTVVFQAAVEACRTVKILSRHQMAGDHPINICHKEGDYLKSLLLWVD